MIQSNVTKVKEVSKPRYVVTMSQKPNGIYIVTAKNNLTRSGDSSYYVDFNLANFMFNQKLNLFEGN
jgi:hypothetical protein